MDTETLGRLRELLKHSQTSLKKCDSSYKGLFAFRRNNPGIAFCLEQLHQGAAALRDYADRLVAILEDLHNTQSVLIEPEETLANDSSLDEERRRNGAIS